MNRMTIILLLDNEGNEAHITIETSDPGTCVTVNGFVFKSSRKVRSTEFRKYRRDPAAE